MRLKIIRNMEVKFQKDLSDSNGDYVVLVNGLQYGWIMSETHSKRDMGGDGKKHYRYRPEQEHMDIWNRRLLKDKEWRKFSEAKRAVSEFLAAHIDVI